MWSRNALALLSNVTRLAASTYDLTWKLACRWLCVRDGVIPSPSMLTCWLSLSHVG